jgi:hypothetical protein
LKGKRTPLLIFFSFMTSIALLAELGSAEKKEL